MHEYKLTIYIIWPCRAISLIYPFIHTRAFCPVSTDIHSSSIHCILSPLRSFSACFLLSLQTSITFVILFLLLTDHQVTLKTLSHSFMVWLHSLCGHGSHQYRHSCSLLDICIPAPVCDVDQVPFTLNPFLKLLTSSLLICTFWITNFPPSILISLSSFFIYLLLRVLLPSSHHTCNLLLHFHLYS